METLHLEWQLEAAQIPIFVAEMRLWHADEAVMEKPVTKCLLGVSHNKSFSLYAEEMEIHCHQRNDNHS